MYQTYLIIKKEQKDIPDVVVFVMGSYRRSDFAPMHIHSNELSHLWTFAPMNFRSYEQI